jgi:hypothetical protein
MLSRLTKTRVRLFTATVISILVASCSSTTTHPRVSVSQPVADESELPFKKVLVVALFDSFDPRRYLEEEIVKRLTEQGADAVRSTSMMDSRTPVVPETFIKMIEEIGADALLLTQLASLKSAKEEVDASPEATMNYWPTYYFNVYQVELTEYVEPPRLNIEHSLVLASQVFSVEKRAPVWGIESRSKFTEIQEDGLRYSVFENEAEAIVRAMRRGGIVAR